VEAIQITNSKTENRNGHAPQKLKRCERRIELGNKLKRKMIISDVKTKLKDEQGRINLTKNLLRNTKKSHKKIEKTKIMFKKVFKFKK
jgi:uncharacterized protein YeeX (DUF496 family)